MAAAGDWTAPVTPPVITEIIEQHAQEAAFLWRLRDAATDQPHYKLRELGELEERVEAHLDGLRVAGEAGLRVSWDQLEQTGEAAELFPVATLALEGRGEASIERVLAFAESVPGAWRGLFGAIGWVPAESLRGLAVTWLDASTPFRRLLGVVACSLHRVDPRSRLESLLEDEPLVRRRALRLVGELGRGDLRARLRPSLAGDDDACRFWAAWSAALLGDRPPAIPVLQTLSIGDDAFKWRALDLAIRLMDRESAISWLRELGQESIHTRLLIVAAGVLGDPTVVPWLIEKMRVPVLARVAGESFSTITGAHLSEHRLDRPSAGEFGASPTDEPTDENVAIDPDENLAWPDPTKVEAWWDKEGGHLTSGVRHLVGRPLSPDLCREVFRDGSQRHRRAAAHELALMTPYNHLLNWRRRTDVNSHRSGGVHVDA